MIHIESEYRQYLESAIEWAKEVGKIHLDYFRKGDLGIVTKSSSHDLLTVADKLSEEFIINQIKREYPSHQILAEESGLNNQQSPFCWVIDPIDGTTNFAQGIPLFSVSIALRCNGSEVVGVVFAPFLNELFYAIKGGGAYLNGQKIAISNKEILNDSLLCTGFPYDHGTNPDNNTDNVSRILPHCRDIRRLGSAAYDMCCVGAGFFDGFWELNLKDWDVAAAMLVIREAGGVVDRLREKPNYCIVAGNQQVVNQMKKYLK